MNKFKDKNREPLLKFFQTWSYFTDMIIIQLNEFNKLDENRYFKDDKI